MNAEINVKESVLNSCSCQTMLIRHFQDMSSCDYNVLDRAFLRGNTSRILLLRVNTSAGHKAIELISGRPISLQNESAAYRALNAPPADNRWSIAMW